MIPIDLLLMTSLRNSKEHIFYFSFSWIFFSTFLQSCFFIEMAEHFFLQNLMVALLKALPIFCSPAFYYIEHFPLHCVQLLFGPGAKTRKWVRHRGSIVQAEIKIKREWMYVHSTGWVKKTAPLFLVYV